MPRTLQVLLVSLRYAAVKAALNGSWTEHIGRALHQAHLGRACTIKPDCAVSHHDGTAPTAGFTRLQQGQQHLSCDVPGPCW